MSMNTAKFAKVAAALALVVSGGAHASVSSQSVAKQLTAISATGVGAQQAIALPPLTSQQDLKAFYYGLPAVSRNVLKATYKALPSSVQARYRKIFKDLPVSAA